MKAFRKFLHDGVEECCDKIFVLFPEVNHYVAKQYVD